MKLKKQSLEMFYQLFFGVVAFWIIIAFPKRISIVPLMVFGAIVFVIRAYRKQEELDSK